MTPLTHVKVVRHFTPDEQVEIRARIGEPSPEAVAWAQSAAERLGLADPSPSSAGRQRKLQQDRERSAARRRRLGQSLRSDYRWQGDEQPWLVLGVSRSTWDRRRKAGQLCDLVAACSSEVPERLAQFCRSNDAAVAGKEA